MEIPNEFELAVRKFLKDSEAGVSAPVSDELIEEAAEHFKSALRKQFQTPREQDFRLRMSNIGKPSCQLWFQKNKPEVAESRPYDFKMRMAIGDALEVVSVFIMKAAGVPIQSVSGQCALDLGENKIKGEYDLVIDGKVWDVKTASPYSFVNKFKSYESVKNGDTFGYVAQGIGYGLANDMPFGGWIAINKSTGEWSFVEAENTSEELDEVRANMQQTIDFVSQDTPEVERCFEDVEETFYKKPTGNRHLGSQCGFCDYKFSCWPDLQYKPSAVSKAKNPPWKYYTKYIPPAEGEDVA